MCLTELVNVRNQRNQENGVHIKYDHITMFGTFRTTEMTTKNL